MARPLRPAKSHADGSPVTRYVRRLQAPDGHCTQSPQNCSRARPRQLRDEIFTLVYRQMRALAGRPLDFDDLVQTAAEQALKSLSEFEGRSELGTWTYRVCYHTLLNEQRWYKRWLRRFAFTADGGLPDGPEPSPAASEALEQAERAGRVHLALEMPGPGETTEGPFKALAPADHTCGLGRDGSVSCWGNSYYGATEAPEGTYVNLVSSGHHSCALTEAGSATCWGALYFEDEDAAALLTAPDEAFTSLVTGLAHVCGLSRSGQAICWGYGGPDADNGEIPNVSQAVAPDTAFTEVAAGFWHTCGLTADGQVQCWGDIDTQPNAD